MKSQSARASRVRVVFGAVAAVIAAAMITLGMTVPAQAAAGPITFTAKLVTKTGAALTNYVVYPLDMVDGNEKFLDSPHPATPVSGKPGYYSMSVVPDDVYTLYIQSPNPTGVSANFQYLGGSALIGNAETFKPDATNNTITATVATGASISGKVTSPSGKDLKDAEVDFYEYDGTNWINNFYAITNSSGNFTETGLDPGSYKLKFYSPDGQYPNIYSGSSATLDGAASTYVGVGDKATVNQKFSEGTGTITGQAIFIYAGDGSDVYYDSKVTPVAVPVTARSGDEPTGFDFSHEIFGSAASSTGKWTVADLVPGDYVMQLRPYYANQEPEYISSETGGSATPDDSTAAIYHVTSGHTVSTGVTEFIGNKHFSGAGAQITVGIVSAGYAVGMDVTISDPSDGYVYASGTSDQNGNAQLVFNDGSLVSTTGQSSPSADTYALIPDEYVVSIEDPNGVYAPYSRLLNFQFGANPINAYLGIPNPAAGFSSSPTVAETSTKIGTTYTVSGAASARPAPAVISYQWLRNGQPIYGATGTSYTATGGDLGEQLTVRATISEFGFRDQVAYAYVGGESSPTVETLGDAPVFTTAPSISPTGNVFDGDTLSAKPGQWTIDGKPATGLHFSYAWANNEFDQTGSTFNTSGYTGETESVDVTASEPGFASSDPATSNSVHILATRGFISLTQAATPVVTDVTQGAQATGTDFTASYGDKLTVTTPGTYTFDGNTVTPDTLTYQWYRNGTAIKGATSASYTIALADLPTTDGPSPISLVETATLSGFKATAGANTVYAEALVAPFPTDPTVSISGNPTSGHTQTASVSSYGVSGVSKKYQWWDCTVSCIDPTDTGDFVKISGATSSTLTLKSSYGQHVYVEVKGTEAGYGISDVVSAILTVVPSTELVALGQLTVSGTVSGDAAVGKKLTATAPTWNQSSVKNTFVWSISNDGGSTWTPVQTTTATSSTTSTFTPTSAEFDVPDLIQVVDTGTKSGYTYPAAGDTFSHSGTSAAYSIVKGTLSTVTAPKVTVKSTSFSVTAGTYSTTLSGTPAYQWSEDETPISGATLSSLPNSSALTGHVITVTVTVSATGYNDLSTTVVAQKGTLIKGTETITGGTALGDPLTVSSLNPFTFDGSAAAVTPTYQWYEGSTAIKGATSPDYTVTSSSYVKKAITVKVTGASADYTSATVTSTAITLGAGSFGTPANPVLSYTGTLQPGTVVTATLSNYGVGSVTYAYKWQRSTDGGSTWSTISGATKSTYTPVATDVTDQLHVIVTATKTGYSTSTLTSVAATVQYSPTLDNFVPPTVAGSGKVGDVLTASAGTWNTPSLGYAYQWFRNGVPIPGATSATWTPTATSYGDAITVEVTASRSGYQPVTADSESVSVTTADAPTDSTAPTVKLSGSTYTVSPGTWNVDGLTYAYQWQDNGTNATGTGATSDTFTLGSGESIADNISVVITVTRFGYTPVTLTVNATPVGTIM